MPRKRLIEIPFTVEAVFLERTNRFLVKVSLDGTRSWAHLHDPGRLSELLTPGVKVLLRKAEGRRRKTSFDVLAVKKGEGLVFVHSGYHSMIAERILRDPEISPFKNFEDLIKEPSFKDSRLDFAVLRNGRSVWIEVKGCTLAEGTTALFPDAPTKRGTKHVKLLAELAKKEAALILFLVFRHEAAVLMPNEKTDPAFAETLRHAKNAGVKLLAYKLDYDGRFIDFVEKIPVVL